MEAESEEAKRFDVLILNLQLALLRAEHRFELTSPGPDGLFDSAQIDHLPAALEQGESILSVHSHLRIFMNLSSVCLTARGLSGY